MSVPVLCAYQFSKPIETGATNVDVVASRAFSKVSSIWVSFSGITDSLNTDFIFPVIATPFGAGINPNIDTGSPPWSPSVRLSIGGKNFPDPAPSDQIALQYYDLVRALGYAPNVTRDDFLSDTYALVFDMKRVPLDHGTGISSRSGDNIRIEIKNLTAGVAKTAHVTMFAYSVVAIRESGVNLLN
jgi:hypothetical protein